MTDDSAAASRRTRAIWESQLVLAASVVVTCVVILALEPDLFGQWSLALGVAGVILLTGLTLGLPWGSIPRSVVLVIPFGDLLSVVLMSVQTDMRLSLLLAFPIIWIATHFSAAALAVALSSVGVVLLVVAASDPAVTSLAGLIVVLVTTTFIGITVRRNARQTRAFKRLLRRQAGRLVEASERAAAEERDTSELLNSVDVGIARISASGQLLVVNDAYARLYGLDRGDLSRPAHSIDYDDHGGEPLPERRRPFTRAARGEQFQDVRLWLFDLDGSWRALSASAKRLQPTDGGEASMLLIVSDVTAIMAAQRERQQMTAMASHEMRHPLTAILGNAELALDYDELTPSARARMDTIHRSSERLLSLLTDFLAQSRSSFAASSSSSTVFDLRTVLIASLESFEVSAVAGGVKVVTHLVEPLLVNGDAFRLRQVADNLVSNAIKYTPRGGAVTVRGLIDGGRVIVAVSDTGIGMPASDLVRVFDPYFRADAAREMAPGNGLGMGITRDIVEGQGGRLGIASESGVGTVLTVDLPAFSDEEVSVSPARAR